MNDRNAPPSSHERSKLVDQRKRTLPQTSTAPSPPTMGGGSNIKAQRERSEAFRREERITAIDRSLHKEKGLARRSFERRR